MSFCHNRKICQNATTGPTNDRQITFFSNLQSELRYLTNFKCVTTSYVIRCLYVYSVRRDEAVNVIKFCLQYGLVNIYQSSYSAQHFICH